MRAITLTQPWALLCALGAKRWETRGWSTQYRGPLLIHSSLTIPPRVRAMLCDMKSEWARIVWAHLNKLGVKHISELPRGYLLGKCELTLCRRVEELTALSHEERMLGDYSPGRYAFELTNVVRFDKIVPAKGALSLWTPSEFTLLELKKIGQGERDETSQTDVGAAGSL